ncbi:transposable element Tcb2 transposase [Trichonephila clavipes]|nr:transposable element Tcb2 transposase [Trichonephila clavipes]
MLFCNGVFQQDNCTSLLSSGFATGWMEEHSPEVYVVKWSPRSPDLNSIGHTWNVLEQGVKTHHTTPTNLIKLRTAASIYQGITVERFQKLIEPMACRVAAVFKASGCPALY